MSQPSPLLFDDEIGLQLRRMTRAAQQRVAIVSPYVKPWGHIKTALEGARSRRIPVTLFAREGELKDEVMPIIQRCFSEVILVESLHAKIYLVDGEAILTSMNLYEYSNSTSKEAGIFLSDPGLVQQLWSYLERELAPRARRLVFQEINAMAQTAPPPQVYQIAPSAPAPEQSILQRATSWLSNIVLGPPVDAGVCIRCKALIPLDEERPYCWACYEVWSVYSNYGYKEKYCHECGKPSKTSRARPLCRSCYDG